MKLKLLPTIVLVIFAFSGFSQTNSDVFIINSSFNANIPPDFKDKIAYETDDKSVKFFEVIYNDSIVDLRVLRSIAPDLAGTVVPITPPESHEYSKISTLVGMFYEASVLKETFIWIKTENSDGRKRIYTDLNQDRDFTNDGPPISIRNVTTSLDVPVLVEGEKDFIRISVEKTKRKKYILRRINNQFVADLGLGAGSGELNYSYDNIGYLANFTDKNLNVGVSYYLGPVVLGVRSSLQNSNFYATYKYVDGVPTTGVNRDKHPLNKLQVGGSLAFRIFLTRTIELQPIGTYGYSYYLNPKYYPDHLFNKEEFFEHSKSTFYEYGFRMVFVVGNQRALYVLGMRNSQDWNPEGLSGTSPLESDLKTTRFEVGYSIGF